MGRISWIAGTAAFVTLASLILAMIHFAQKEYTEEIERLRRDLLAAREKNGIYLDPYEYERMTGKMNELEEQNSGKVAHLKALKEEMEKMEALCNDLHMQVEEKTSALIQKTEMLVETEGRLKSTQTALVKTFRDKELNQRLVDYHSEKEKELGDQAKTLLKVADQTTDDISRLHDKLSRKRSVEEGNRSRSVHFKENFHKNYGRMGDWLEKLLLDHTAFCMDLRSALGEQQDHKISELTALSEHLTSQVQMLTTSLHDMERQSAEATRQAQHWVHNHLEGIRASTGASAEALRTSLMDLILPPMDGLTMQLQKIQTNLQEMSSQVNDLIREREHEAEVDSAETINVIDSLEESVSQFVHVQKQEIEWLKTAHNNYVEDSERETKEMRAQMDAMKEMFERLYGMLETKQQRENITATDIREGMSRSESACSKFDSEMKKISQILKKKRVRNAETHKRSSEKILQTFSDFTVQSNVVIGSAQNLREEAVSSCWSAVTSNEDAWREQYQAAEEELRQHADMLKKYLQSGQEQNQRLLNKVRETAEVQESLLESQRNSFKSFVQQRKDEVEAECSSFGDQVKVISDELKKRQIELHHFFTNELVEDRPTGETPPRREFPYPRRLVASSPRERVIQRVLAQMDEAPSISLILNNAENTEENVGKFSTSTRSLPDTVEHITSEFEADTSIQKAISEIDIPTMLENSNSDTENQVDDGDTPVENENKSAIPTAKGQRRTLRLRKPLIAKNLE